jgi:hypothetical protein
LQAIIHRKLKACSDRSHSSKGNGIGCFFSELTTVICKGSGPVDGHPRFLSSYRSETSGIVEGKQLQTRRMKKLEEHFRKKAMMKI